MSMGNAEPQERPPLLSVENLEVLYSEVILALKGVNLKVAEGGCTALLGPNGAGKSSTLKAISVMLAVAEGEVSGGAVRSAGHDLAVQVEVLQLDDDHWSWSSGMGHTRTCPRFVPVGSWGRG